MSRSTICIETRGPADWQSRLASPKKHWKKGRSAFEAAVSWERIAKTSKNSASGMPREIEELFNGCNLNDASLLLAIVERETRLSTKGGNPQSDVFALVRTSDGLVSATVEAKVDEEFGQPLVEWLNGGKSKDEAARQRSRDNRRERWESELSRCLPEGSDYLQVRYQLLQRTAAAVIEAENFDAPIAVVIVQAFPPGEDRSKADQRFAEYAAFCDAIGVPARRNTMTEAPGGAGKTGKRLFVGWVDSPAASETDILQTACPS